MQYFNYLLHYQVIKQKMSKKKKCSEKVMMCLKKSYLRTLHSHQQNRSLIKIKFTFKQIHELLMHIFMVFVKKKNQVSDDQTKV